MQLEKSDGDLYELHSFLNRKYRSLSAIYKFPNGNYTQLPLTAIIGFDRLQRPLQYRQIRYRMKIQTAT